MKHLSLFLASACVVTALLFSCKGGGVVYLPGKIDLVSETDSLLNGNSFLTGTVRRAPGLLVPDYEISVKGSALRSVSNINGSYSIALAPGIYSFRCQYNNNTDQRLVVDAKDVVIRADKKVIIDFYPSTVAE